jgi:hypothetical protein
MRSPSVPLISSARIINLTCFNQVLLNPHNAQHPFHNRSTVMASTTTQTASTTASNTELMWKQAYYEDPFLFSVMKLLEDGVRYSRDIILA